MNCNNYFIANPNQFLSESGRFLIIERRGIKTDLFAIERYVEEVLNEILSKSTFNFNIILGEHARF